MSSPELEEIASEKNTVEWGWVDVQLLSKGLGVRPLALSPCLGLRAFFTVKHEGGSYLVASRVPQVAQCCHSGQGSLLDMVG